VREKRGRDSQIAQKWELMKSEDQIRRAIEQGDFEDLPGKGKPLKLEENPLGDPDWELAYHLLKSGGFTLPWIELQQEIDGEIEAGRAALREAWERRKVRQQTDPRVEEQWRRALERFAEQVARINQRIFDYNLQVPALPFQRVSLKLELEVEKITGS